MDWKAVEEQIAGTIFAGRLHWFAQIDSTNLHAMEQGRGGAAHGSVYVADEQLAGRGRGDHRWHSAAGEGLYVSVLVQPKLQPSELVWLPLMAGLALHRAIAETTALEADLRWPNDMLIAGSKCAGILVEAQVDAGGAGFAVIGIGVNLRQREFPPNLATSATSLELETGRAVATESMLTALLVALDGEVRAMSATGMREAYFAGIPARLEAISTWIRGKRVEVHGPKTLLGRTVGLNGQGFLQVATDGGVETILTGGLREVGE